MPRFQCLKGYWVSPIEVETIRDAEMIFRCPDCVMNDSHCLGMVATPRLRAERSPSPTFSVGEQESRVVSALELLAQARPQSVKLTYAPNERGRTCRHLRGYVAAYYDEILSARQAGHGFNTIAQVMTENGISISHATLRDYFNAIWRDNNDQA